MTPRLRLTTFSPIMAVLTLLASLLCVGPSLVLAQQEALLITYGQAASSREGDPDHQQAIRIVIPASVTDTLFLRVFDADCGGGHDAASGEWDTQTRLRLYDGQNTDSALLAERVLGVDAFWDQQWHTFAKISPKPDSANTSDRILLFTVEGLAGDDGNVFNLTVSRSERDNQLVAGVRLQHDEPTIRLPDNQRLVELPFFIPAETQQITLHNFDAAGATITLELPERSDPSPLASGQDNWQETTISLEPSETGQQAAITFRGGNEIPNDATFYLTDQNGERLPIDVPGHYRPPNQRPAPVVQTRALSDCYTIVFDGSASTDPENDPLSFTWFFGDGASDEGERITHRYEEWATYQAEVVVSDHSGHVGNSTRQPFAVTLNHPPTAAAGSDQVVAPGQICTLDAVASSDPDGRLVRFRWELGDGSVQEGQSIRHTYDKPGFYTVHLRVEDDADSPCNFATDSLTVWVNAQPVVDIGADKISSPGETVRFEIANHHDSDGSLVAYTWDFGDGAQADGASVQHQYAEPGTYTVTLTVRDDANVVNSSATDQLHVFVNDQPIAQIETDMRSNRTVAVGEAIAFDGTESVDSDGNIIAYRWDFGDGTTGSGEQITHVFTEPGQYEVTLTIEDDSGSSTSIARQTVEVVVNQKPVARAGSDQLVTASEVSFDGSASADPDGELTQFAWDFGDGNSGTGPTPSHVYRAPGTYQVVLTVTDNSGTRTSQTADTLSVIVNARPVADAGLDQEAAPDETITFDGTSSFDPDGEIAAWQWDFGDGQPGEGPTVTHAYARPGTYTVRLKVQDDTGHENAIDFDEAIVRINAAPEAVLDTKPVHGDRPLIVAPEQRITFDASRSSDPDGQIASYQWTSSDGFESSDITFTHAFTEPGIYTVSLTVADGSDMANSQARDQVTVRVNQPPRPVIAEVPNTCATTITFDASASTDPDGDPLHFEWDFGDQAVTGSGQTPIHTFSGSGTYPIFLTVDDGTDVANATATTSTTVTINAPPIADAGGNMTVCAGDIVLFDGSRSEDPESGLLNFQWNLGNGTTSTGVNPTHVYKKGGIYTVTLTVSDDSGLSCNSDTDQMVIRVVDSPIAEAGPDQTVCANTKVEFDGSQSWDADGVVNRFQWDFDDGTVVGGATPTHTFTQAGVYRVRLTITGDRVGDCDNTDSDEVIITVYDAPVAHIDARTKAAVAEPVTFDGTQSVASDDGSINIIAWQWDFGDSITTEGSTVTHAYLKPGVYPVSLTVVTDSETECNTTTVMQTIRINDAPLAQAGTDRLAAINEPIRFNAGESLDADGSIIAYDWDFGDGKSERGLEVQHAYAKPGTYWAVLTVTDNADVSNSSTTDSVRVTINAPPQPHLDIQPDIAHVGETLTFDASRSTDADGEIQNFEWSFGDGRTATGAEVTHQYAQPGLYTVSLTADDGSQAANHLARRVQLVTVHAQPVADGGPDRVVCPDEMVPFQAAPSPDSLPLSYTWQLDAQTTKTGSQITHAFTATSSSSQPNGGNWIPVTLTVADESGSSFGQAQDTIMVRINSQPEADAGPDRDTFAGGAHDVIYFDGSNSSDPDGDPLTFWWDFGDGTTASGQMVAHTYQQAGSYVVKLRVRDDSGTTCNEAWDEIRVSVKARE